MSNETQQLAHQLRLYFTDTDTVDKGLLALSHESDPLGRRLLKIAARNANEGHYRTARWLIAKALDRVRRAQ